MDRESTRYLRLLERRLELLGSLAKALARSRPDFIAMDLAAMEIRIAEQEQLCAQIRSVDMEIHGFLGASSENRTSLVDERIPSMIERMEASQWELKRLNDAHQAMLRRSRHMVNVLTNLLRSYAPTYSRPVVTAPSGLLEERA